MLDHGVGVEKAGLLRGARCPASERRSVGAFGRRRLHSRDGGLDALQSLSGRLEPSNTSRAATVVSDVIDVLKEATAKHSCLVAV